MRLLLFILSFTVFFISCGGGKSSGLSYQGQQGDNRFAKSRIILQRTECYGTCPVDKITINGDGSALYEGEKFTDKVGKYRKQLKEREINTLFNKFECANFFDFQSEYTEPVTDLPTKYLTFEHRGFKKTVKDYYGAPEELKTLEKLVEQVINSEGWEKMEE